MYLFYWVDKFSSNPFSSDDILDILAAPHKSKENLKRELKLGFSAMTFKQFRINYRIRHFVFYAGIMTITPSQSQGCFLASTVF